MTLAGALWRLFQRAGRSAAQAAPVPPEVAHVAEVEGAATPPAIDISAAAKAAGFRDLAVWGPVLAAAMKVHGIHGRANVAAFLANTAHETNGGTALVESLNYSPERLRAVFGERATDEAMALCRQPGSETSPPQAADQRGIANQIYGGAWGLKNLGNKWPGDGWQYRGRGLIQVTGRRNYEDLARYLGMELVAMMTTMESPAGAAMTAARWWSAAGLNTLAAKDDIEAVRRRVNGGLTGIADVKQRYQAVMEAI